MRSVTRTVLVASLMGVPLIAAFPQGRALTIEDYYRLRTVGAPQMSPDGRWVAYTVSRRIESTNGDSSEVWIASTQAPQPRRVSASASHATMPLWASDGRLTFAAGGRRWALNPDVPDSIVENSSVTPQSERFGGGVVRVLTSADDKRIAAVRNMPVQKRDRAFASDFEKRHEERFKGVQFDWLDFQRDGQPFPVPNRTDPEVSPPQELFVADSDGPARQLTRLSLRPAGVAWSPDARALVFTADMGYRDERRYGASAVYTVNLDGNVRRVTVDSEYNHSSAQFSPDGKWILFTRQLSTDAVIARKLEHGGPTDLAIVPADGGTERNLTANWDLLPSNAEFSPDGKFVYFEGGIGGATHVFRVAANGADPVTQVTTGERRITNVSFDKAMTRMAYSVGLIEAPSEIYVANIDGSNERRITNVHESFVREIALSKADRLRFPSKDGTQIEGWLLYPHGYAREKGPYPLVVSNHGGPHSADGYVFDFKNQFLAANGYFVLEVNFRSSTGYGEKFLWGTWGAWGDRDGEDVMAGIDHVLARLPIARARVAAMGHSYGGFMTNWLITQYPDRFAAAVAGAGIVNWVSDYGTADIARTKETEFFGYPWEEKARNIMIRQSPLTYAGRVKTPTLFVHGEVDQRVPYSEAEQMYVALKKLGVPAKMIQYQGMAHGITGSWNNVHRMLNELRWLNQYLGARPAP